MRFNHNSFVIRVPNTVDVSTLSKCVATTCSGEVEIHTAANSFSRHAILCELEQDALLVELRWQ